MQRDGGPGGAGGAGNPVGGGFTGAAEALEIIGNHAYALSGMFESSTTEQTMLDFTSGNYYAVGRMDVYAPVASPADGGTSTFQLFYNGVNVLRVKVDSNANDAPAQGNFELIIPPYTEVRLVVDCLENSATELVSASFSGRIYRG